MSTDIRMGYRFSKSLTLTETREFVSSVQPKIDSLLKEIVNRKAAEIVSRVIDMAHVTSKSSFLERIDDDYESLSLDSTPYWIAHDTLSKRFRQNKAYERTTYDREYDFLCNLVFYASEEKTLLQVFAECPEFCEEIFDEEEMLEKFDYWDHSDPPKGIPYEDWELRYEEWKKVMKPTWVPDSQGFKVCGVVHLPSPSDDQILSYIPTSEERAKKIARELLIDRKMKELWESDPKNRDKSYHHSLRWVNSKEGKVAIEDEVISLKKILLPSFDESHLHAELSQWFFKKKQKSVKLRHTFLKKA